jgi:hypothetical protein
MFILSLKRYDIKINCFEITTETGVLNNLCFKNCVAVTKKMTKGQILRSYSDSAQKMHKNQLKPNI